MPVLYEGEIQIPFDPTDRDVVSTKLRHWTLTHPGTLEYGRLLNEFVEHKLPNNPSTISELKEAAQEIIDIIQLDRGGRFLRISADAGHEPKVCILMTPKGIMSKVQSALKGKQTALLKKQGIFVPQGPKTLGFTTPLETPSCRNEGEKRKAATEEPTATTPTTSINTTTATPKSKRKKLGHSNSGNTTPRYPKHVTKLYKAIIPTDTSSTTTPITTSSTDKNKETNKETMVVPNSNIHPYALELIGHVCNFRNIACLDKPLPTKYQYPEDEPEKERLIRMQLRHRFYCAAAIRMTITTFARKLVEDVWGGKLVVEDNTKHKEADEDDDPYVTDKGYQHRANLYFYSGEDDGNDQIPPNAVPLEVPPTLHSSTATQQQQQQQRREYYHEDQSSSGRRRRASQKFMDALDEDPEGLEGVYRWGGRIMGGGGDEFFDSAEGPDDSLQDKTLPSLHTAFSHSTTGGKKNPAYGAKKRKKQKKAKPKAYNPPPAAYMGMPKTPGKGRSQPRSGCFTFEDRQVQMKEFFEIHGHLKVPTAKQGIYYNLGAWLAAQKSLYRKGGLKSDRLKVLRELGCVGFGGPAG